MLDEIKKGLQSLHRPGVDAGAVACCIFLGFAAIGIVYCNTLDLDLRIALHGFSAMEFINNIHEGVASPGAYPSGVAYFKLSLPMYLYLLADAWGIDPRSVMPVMIGLEVLGLSLAGVIATRVLRPSAGWPGACLVALFMIAGNLAYPDFGRWGHPYYLWVYNFAYAFLILGVIAVIREKMILAAILLALAVLCHLTLGVIGIAFATAAALVQWRRFINRRMVLAGLLLLAIVGGWLFFIVGFDRIVGGSVPADRWVAIHRITNYHFFPIDYGLFWQKHQERLIPFFAVTILLVLFLRTNQGPMNSPDRQMAAGFIMMVVITVAGLVISVACPDPMLVKLALQRASGVLLLFGVVYVVSGLWEAVRCRPLPLALISVMVLVSPFRVGSGVPWLAALLMAGPVIVTAIRQRRFDPPLLIVNGLVVVSAVWLALFAVAGVLGDIRNPAYTGYYAFSSMTPYWQWLMIGVFVSALASRRLSAAQPILVGVMGLAALLWAWDGRDLRDNESRAQAAAYLDLQLWIKDHTAKNEIMMFPPTLFYGGRDFSQRGSFGNLREWLQNGWMNDLNLARYNDGMRRFGEFGLPLNNYLHDAPPMDGYDRLVVDVRMKYNMFGRDWFEHIRDIYGIHYFIFDKHDHLAPSPIPLAYENPGFALGYLPAPQRTLR